MILENGRCSWKSEGADYRFLYDQALWILKFGYDRIRPHQAEVDQVIRELRQIYICEGISIRKNTWTIANKQSVPLDIFS